VGHRFPAALPDGKGLVYSVKVGAAAGDWRVVALSYETGKVVPLVDGGLYGRYAPSGHLVYGSAGSLYAVPMDLDPIRVRGSGVPVVEDVATSAQHGIAAYSFSKDGTLAYLPTSAQAAFRTALTWVDRDGRRAPAASERLNASEPRFSPDGSRLAVTVWRDEGWDIEIYHLERGVFARLTTAADNQAPVWTPDGERVVFQSNRTGSFDLYWTRADGVGGDEALTNDTALDFPTSISPTGTLAFQRSGKAYDIWTLDLGGDTRPSPLLASEEDEANPVFSPDGRWIAYEVWQDDRPEIFVVPYPLSGRRSKISLDGGSSPVWSRSTPELFYMERGERMMVVRYEVVGGEFRPGPPRLLFEAGTRITGWPTQLFDVTSDARRFLMPEAADLSRVKVVLVQNWFAELERLVPTR
jgi:hypothetical protein